MPFSDDTILLDEKTDLVSFSLKVDGTEVPRSRQIDSINITYEINKIPSAAITIIDGETNKEDFEISSSGEFSPGKEVEIEIGYNNDNKTAFKGIIVANTHRVDNDCSELDIECRHDTVKMTINRRSRHFSTNITAADAAEELLSSSGITNTNIEPVSLQHPQLLQSNITDWDFMIGRLEAAGMACLINNDLITIKKLPADTDAVMTLTYGRNILEFNADRDTRNQSESVRTYRWDFRTQQVSEAVNEESGVTESEEGSITGENPYEIRTSADLSAEEAAAISTAKKLRQDLSKIKARVKYLGTLTAKPGDFIELQGAGDKFNGKAFVSAVHHEYSDGCWTTEATLGWDEQFFSERVNPGHSASSTAQPSSIQGLQIGVVTSIEDPEGEYRVKIRLPVVDDQAEGFYARTAALDAGKNRGTYFRPEIGDEVIVGFLNDTPSSPVILGMLHSGLKPAPFEPESSNNIKGYVSRSGIKMIFDDGGNKLTLITPASRTIVLDDSEASITVKDDSGNKIILNQEGITMESGSKIKLKAGTEIALEAPVITLSADTTLSLEGSGNVTLGSSGITEVKGSVVKIN